MRTFVAVVEADGFTAAGQRLGKSKALVSKHVGELEERLGARLLNRTTRRVNVTSIGRAYYDRACGLLQELDGLEESVRLETSNPRGTLKITAPQTLADASLLEMLTAFRAKHPDVDVDVFMSDRFVDVVAEGFDVALRISAMQDSSLIARKLCDIAIILVASPDYIKARGKPKKPEDLAKHNCIIDTNIRWRDNWRFHRGGKPFSVRVKPTISVNSAGAVRQLILSGSGIGFAPELAVAHDLHEGRMVKLLESFVDYKLGFHIVYPHRLHLSAKVRAFIDFAADWYTPSPPWEHN